MAELQSPDGIDNLRLKPGLWDRHASPISFLVLAAILAGALVGLAGGQPNPVSRAALDGASLSVRTPLLIRNGEFFETVIEVQADRPLADATLAVSADMWRDMTINTMIPAPADEAFKSGSYHFAYGPLAAGDTLRVKIDGQINPPLFAGTRGTIALYDGDDMMGRRPLRIRVLP